MQSQATSVAEYLNELSPDRREAVETVRQVILENIDPDYEEGMLYGMIGYYVPHRIYPAGYHCDPTKPVCFAGLASQKNYLSLYMMCIYGGKVQEEWFRQEWAKTGKKLDMGKSCIRFKKVDDLALDLIAETLRRVPVKTYLAFYEASREEYQSRPAKKTARKTAAKKSVSGKTAPRGARQAQVAAKKTAVKKSAAKKAARAK